ncbi:DUF2812 domain-containing protein [Corynebacterium phoceense]|uniref:DUF2812 domain-containing protein n=1 Tax=Corynebacterium phoceense TaxID=1686286 RepID=UPI00211CFD15|nr:DUF2812 domain-containing protein [Corynebacterium phoceense]MCQ9331413.1 DUF2812 domain-containing protein [Corynebacterium phoceense]MCQ9348240.1 DUF2812 domain-containing protein [Corynebacterium phoceense]
MKTVKLSGGMAFSQDRELETFSRMAARGKRLVGLGALGHGWSFEDAEPEQAIFDVAYESKPDSGYFELFDKAGWARVFSHGNMHVFKAAPGTPPVHTTVESQRDELVALRNLFARYAAVAVGVFVILGVLTSIVDWNKWIEFWLLVVAVIPLVYTVMPLTAYTVKLCRMD